MTSVIIIFPKKGLNCQWLLGSSWADEASRPLLPAQQPLPRGPWALGFTAGRWAAPGLAARLDAAQVYGLPSRSRSAGMTSGCGRRQRGTSQALTGLPPGRWAC